MKNYNLTCQVCHQTGFTYHTALTNHLKIHKLDSRSYYNQYLRKENEEICECGKITRWNGFIKGYSPYCPKCIKRYAALKQWEGNEDRRNRLRTSSKPYLRKGRKKGSKNKNPYPFTNKVIERIKSQITHPNSIWENYDAGLPHPEENNWKELNDGMNRVLEIAL